MESQHDLISLFEHDLFGKPVSTFPDHALTRSAARFATHRILKMTLKSGALSVKATSRSSTARPQEKPEIPIPLPILRANGSRECAPDDRPAKQSVPAMGFLHRLKLLGSGFALIGRFPRLVGHAVNGL